MVGRSGKGAWRAPWVVAMLVWCGVSWLVLVEYRRLGGQARELHELWFLMSLLWAQFGFAAMFADWRHNRGRGFHALLLRTLAPPLLLQLVLLEGW